MWSLSCHLRQKKQVEPIAEAANLEAPSISIHDAVLKSKFGSEVVKEIYFQMIRQHLAAGTDFNALNNYGETPLDLPRAKSPTLFSRAVVRLVFGWGRMNQST